jgi:hypothetical protein
MLLFRLDCVAAIDSPWGSPDGTVNVHGTTADGDDGVHLQVSGLRPFVSVVLPAASPPFDEERTAELTTLLAPVLASAAGYRGRRLKLSLCTQALERTRIEYEDTAVQSDQPLRLGSAAPARILRILFNCSIVASEVARVLQAPEAAAAAWTYPRQIDADSLVAMLGDARGGIRVLAPETARGPAACFTERTGVALKRWCTADTAWPDVEHEHDGPVTLKLQQFHPAAAPAKRKRSDADPGDAASPARDWRVVRNEQLALAEGWVARRAFDESLAFLFEAALWKTPRLHALFSDDELRTAASPFIVAVFLAQDLAEAEDSLHTDKEQVAVKEAKLELAEKWTKRPEFATRLVFLFESSKSSAGTERQKEKLPLVEQEQLARAERWVARRAFEERLEYLFEAVLWENPHLHALFAEADLQVAHTECIERRRECKDRRVKSLLLEAVKDAKDKALGRGLWGL